MLVCHLLATFVAKARQDSSRASLSDTLWSPVALRAHPPLFAIESFKVHPRHLIQRGRVLLLLFCATLSGCVTVPVVAKTSTGEKFLGSATASLTSGTFELTSVDGLRCWGTYDQWDPSTTLRVDFKASDGRYGTALIARDSTGTSGIGTGKANDGTTFDFYMGNSINQIQSTW